MRTSILPFLFLTATLCAQTIPACRLSPLDTYLGFDCNSPQAEAIRRNNNEHERWRVQKERRIYQVRSEIADETNRSPLDPTALGLRHAEVEAICREIDERELQLVKLNRDVLTEPQKLKLAALEEVMRLAPTVNSAIGDNLIHADQATLNPLAGSVAGFLLGLGPYPPWPPKQRTAACAANTFTRLGIISPPPIPAP